MNFSSIFFHSDSPLGALQLDLYTRQAGPIVINAPENSTCIGKLHLRVNYDSKCSDLQIHLIEAHDLCPFEEGGFREVYVRLELKPEIDQRKRETNIFRFDTNPYFNQHFKFPVSRDQLSEKELILLVSSTNPGNQGDLSKSHLSRFSMPTSVQVTYPES